MTGKTGKTTSTETNTGSAEYKPEQSADTAQLVDLLTQVLKKVQEQVGVESKPQLFGKAEQAVVEFKEISKSIRVPTQRNNNIEAPKWNLPPVNPRARQKP